MTNRTSTPSDLRRPTVVVSMPAYNAARFIGPAIESVLAQEGVDVELVVVDDASHDGTGDVAARYAERGVRVLRNPARRGIGYCHNRVIFETTAPLIAHVDADDVILPGALLELASAATSDERVGQAYCDFCPIDAAGNVSADDTAYWRRHFALYRAPPLDHAHDLVVHGMVVSALRTYRRVVFDKVGGFDEALPWAVDYEMALRMAEHFSFVHVPRVLYGRRMHAEGATQNLRGRAWRFWWMRWKLVRRQLRRQGGSLYGFGRWRTHARLMKGLAHLVRAAAAPSHRDV